MGRRRAGQRFHYDVWPVIADAFLALLAVVVVMASGRQPVDNEVEQFKKEIVEKSHKEFSGVLADVEVRTKWARLVLTTWLANSEDSSGTPEHNQLAIRLPACILGLEVRFVGRARKRSRLQCAEITEGYKIRLLHCGARNRMEIQNEQPPEQPPLFAPKCTSAERVEQLTLTSLITPKQHSN